MIKLLYMLLLLFAANICKAQLADEINRHFIVAIDVVPASCYRSVLQSTTSRAAIEKVSPPTIEEWIKSYELRRT